MTLAIYKDVPGTIPSGRLRRLFTAVTAGEKRSQKPGRVNLIFTSPRAIRSLNATWRGKNKVTDVLSFTIDETPTRNEVFGEVYICSQVARIQAKEYDGTLDSEFLRLACHGFLHLFGHDHHRASEARRMRLREVRYLKGITEVYY
ncbi:MAG: rRNA maturation RNase YbeY [Candidatus Zixiibacteriota bacterium]